MKFHRPQQEKTNTKEKERWGLLFAGIVLAAAAMATGLTAARYVHQWKSDSALAEAKAFYFTSDLLKEADQNAVYQLYSWGDGIRIQLQNFEDEKRYSETDITYEVTYTLTGGTTIESEKGTIASGGANGKTVTVIPEPGAKTVTVTAKATGPYQKTLTAAFELQDTDQPQFQVVDQAGNAAAELIIKGGNTTQKFKLKWNPAKVAPDRTNPLFQKAVFEDGAVEISITASGSGSLLLFKKDPTQNFSMKEQGITDNTISLNDT